MHSMDMLDQGIINLPGRAELDGARVHHATKNEAKFKTYKLFNSGVFHLILTEKSKSTDEGDSRT